MAFATAARPGAIRELQWSQVDLTRGLVYLNPEGRQQTDKHRTIVPLGPVALAEIKNWTRTAETVLEYNGAPLATNEFFDTLLAEAGVEDC